ncbi:MAG: carboxypeptidase regulatory-like domain-containing protein [Vicinamibacterales bacterium]
MGRQALIRYAAAVALVAAGAPGLQAQGGAALTGTVSSSQEGKMEGVLVTARLDGANFDVTVVSDAQGKYSFPRTHLKGAGKATIKTRAVGFDLASANTVTVDAGKAATLDLTLDKAKDLSKQLTSTEWLNSIAGTDEQKSMVQRQIESCTYCHSMERIVKSRHNAEQFIPVINRMFRYYPDGTMAGTEVPPRGRAKFHEKESADMFEKMPSWGYAPGVKKPDLAAYLATINMSGGKSLPTDLKTLPRPKGKATKVIVTQYDMPRKDTVPHDSDVDSKGNVWYTDQTDYFLGKFDAKTGTFKEWPLPKPAKHTVGGGSDIQLDNMDRPWFTVTHDKIPGEFGMIGMFDPATEKYEHIDLGEARYSQFIAKAKDGHLVLGGLKIDPVTKKLVDKFDFAKAPNDPGGTHMGYEPAMDSKGNWYITDFGASYMIQIEAKTKKVNWIKTPTAFSEPRRGKMDDQDRLWFAEYTADNIAMLDGKTLKITEWPTGIKWGSPYTATTPDAKGRVYAPAGSSDRVFRLDPKTGEVVGYLMPTQDFDVKQATIDPTDKKTVWMANVRNARIVKLEVLD